MCVQVAVFVPVGGFKKRGVHLDTECSWLH